MSKSNSTPTPALPNGAIVFFQHGYQGNGSAHVDLVKNLKDARPSSIYKVDMVMRSDNRQMFNTSNLNAKFPDETILIRTEFSNKIGRIHDQVFELKRMIDRVRSVLGTTRPIYLVGHSKGGLVNMQLTITHPGLVKKIISIGTPYNFNIMGFAQSILDDIFEDASIKAIKASKPIIATALAGASNLLDQFVSDEDLGNPDTFRNLKNNWNALTNKPQLTAIGCSQIGLKHDSKSGGDIVVSYASQVADGYKDVIKKLVDDKYIKVLPDNLWGWLKLALNRNERISDIIESLATFEPLTILLGVILSAFVADNDKPSTYDLIHTKQLNNKNVCLEVLDAFDRVNLPPSLPMYSDITY